VLLIAAALAATETCAGQASSKQTIDGPEATDLIKGVRGYILMTKPASKGIAAVTLPSLQEKAVYEPGPDAGPHSVGGPDAEGRAVFVEGYWSKRRHALKVIRPDGKDELELFSRPGDSIWDEVIGRGLSLSPAGGQVALVSRTRGEQMDNPPAYLTVGSLEVWDVSRKAGRQTGVTAMEDALPWFPDGKRLAYVEFLAREKVPAGRAQLGDFGAGFKNWAKLPAVHVLDIATGTRTFLHVGWQPVVSSDGKTVLVSDWDRRWRLVDVASRESKAVQLPGVTWRGAVALLEGRLALYWGRPTTGTPLRYTQFNSPLSGEKLMFTLKLADLDSHKFQTMVSYIDPRMSVSFGPGQAAP
jgi:hypothetical protein